MSERDRQRSLPPDLPLPPRHADAPAPGADIPIHWSQCACCGPAHPGGLRLRFVAGPGLTVTGRFEVTGLQQGAPGLAHGGLLAAALDECLGTLNWLVGVSSVTARLAVDFVRPVPVGSTVFLSAEVVGRQGRQIHGRASGRLDSPEGPIAIRATSVFVEVPADHFRQHGRGIDVEAAVLERSSRLSQLEFEVNP